MNLIQGFRFMLFAPCFVHMPQSFPFSSQQEGGEPLVSGRERRAMGRDRWGDIYANMPVKKMVALYDYDPQELSPNVDSEVTLCKATTTERFAGLR